MDTHEFRQLIAKPEWADVELKAARNQYPKEALSSVSAFANTGGGYLIFGVDERQDDPLVGVIEVDQVQNAFIGLLKDTKKFSSIIRFNAELIELDGNYFLVFHIEEALRHEKPIYLNGELKQTFLRKGGRDDKASDEDMRRMIRDASTRTRNEEVLDLDPESCFDTNTIKWYRKVYESRHGDKYFDLSHIEFMDQFGLVKEIGDELKPTYGAVLMFGAEKYVRQIMPRFTLDAYWHQTDIDSNDGDIRWHDRRSYECNLFDTWRQLSERFMYHADTPFEIDETNLQRKSETPDYIGFREAAVNVLIHQDYSDASRCASIHFHRDATVYYNPGDSLVDDDRLGKGDSESRNPIIMQTFHRIGLSDRAGSGIKDIYKNWQQLDRPVPLINNDKARKAFQITLGKKANVSELQNILHERIGVKLSEPQAQIFVHCLAESASVSALAATLSMDVSDIYPAVDVLSRQGLLVAGEGGYLAPDHFQAALADLVVKVTNLHVESDQPQDKVTNLNGDIDQPETLVASLNKKQKLLIQHIDGRMDLKELMTMVGMSHRSHFKNKQLQPLIDNALVDESYPENPHHPEQAYFLTAKGEDVRRLLGD